MPTSEYLCFPELPHFIAKPSSSVTVKEKQNLSLPCSAGGFPPPAITWYKDGDVIGKERKQFKKRNLEIKEIQFEDRGNYTCAAENILGRVQSSVNVTVKGIYYISITQIILQNTTITSTCPVVQVLEPISEERSCKLEELSELCI